MKAELDWIGAQGRRRIIKSTLLGGLLVLCVRGPSRADTAPGSNRIEARDGLIEFTADTNVPALKVHGRGHPSRASAVFHRQGPRIVFQKLEARIPVNQLSTGMSLRDKHMRERIFVRSDGTAPDLVFVAEQVECAAGAAPCVVAGQLTIRGESRPFNTSLKVDALDGDREIKVSGEAVVKLSDYGIAAPKQLGVSVADAVIVQFRLVGGPVRLATP